jgi:hypothetical protein
MFTHKNQPKIRIPRRIKGIVYNNIFQKLSLFESLNHSTSVNENITHFQTLYSRLQNIQAQKYNIGDISRFHSQDSG